MSGPGVLVFMRRLAAAAAGSCLALLAFPAQAQKEPPAPRPNVILIMADDMGYSDLGCYGGEIETPNLDRLAEGGLRFTQFYNAARCCPTRASLLTGLYPHQTGMGHMTHHDRGHPGYRADLNRQCVTIAEVLRDAGYRTYMSGKWHVTRHERPNRPKHNWPLQRGFEKFYGIIWGSGSFFDPALCRDNTWYSRDNDPGYRSDNYYLTTALAENALSFLRQHEKESPDKPFFLYLAFTAPHWPMHALEEDIAKYRGRFDKGYDALRRERVERMKKLGLLPPEWTIPPTVGRWEDVKNREWELRCMEVYAAMIDRMDREIGRVVAELKRQGRLDSTLILFLQDNGACAEPMGRQPRRPAAPSFEPLRPDQLPLSRPPLQTREGKPVLSGTDVMPGGPDSYIAYGENWANVSNTPFREYKHWVHEGGISTPLIVHWPAGIPESRKNSFVHDPGHLIDIMATCVDVAGTTYPSERGGEKIKPLQGISLRPAFEGRPLERKEPLFWEHEGNRAVRRGKWKLVAKEGQPWELYDMEADRTEMHDLASERPELVRELAAAWDAWAGRSDVLPLGGWKENRTASGPPVNRVEVRAGDALAPDQSPWTEGRTLRITAEIPEPRGDGVLVAHGGLLHGYALYVRDGRLAFALRRDGRLQTVAADEPLGDRPTTVTVSLGPKGRVTLRANGRTVAGPTPVGPLPRTPGQGLSAGFDSEDPTGDYPPEFRYPGRLGTIVVETKPRG